jgi:hypothetical protein
MAPMVGRRARIVASRLDTSNGCLARAQAHPDLPDPSDAAKRRRLVLALVPQLVAVTASENSSGRVKESDPTATVAAVAPRLAAKPRSPPAKRARCPGHDELSLVRSRHQNFLTGTSARRIRLRRELRSLPSAPPSRSKNAESSSQRAVSLRDASGARQSTCSHQWSLWPSRSPRFRSPELCRPRS